MIINFTIKKYSFFFITTFVFNVSYAIFYLLQFYSKDFKGGEGDSVINLISFQASSTILLIFFSILNPMGIFTVVKNGVRNRKEQNKKYFDIGKINILPLDNVLTPYLMTLLVIFVGTIILFLSILILKHLGFPILEILEFPFRFAKNINQSELYYGVYSFLFINVGYILSKPKKSIQTYLLKFIVFLNSGFYSFFVCVFFVLLNMFLYFSSDEIGSDIFEDKAKIAYAMFFNLIFVFNCYLVEKGYINLEKE